MKAIVVRDKKSVLDQDRSVPELRDDYILVRPVAVALNPTDWKTVAFGMAKDGCLAGCDFAGIVEDVGSAVSKDWKRGDRVAGVAHGANAVQREDGAFAEYIVAKGDVQMRIPESMSFEDAATVSLGAMTCGQGLYQKGLKLQMPSEPVHDKRFVLIYGAATATGALGVQFATLSGYSVIATCSPRNFDYVKSLGAVETFDYSEKDVGQKIRSYTEDKLMYAWDTIGKENSQHICSDALSSQPGCRYACVLPTKSPREDVESVSTVMFTMFGEAFTFGPNQIPPMAGDFEFAKTFMGLTERLLAEGKLKTHRVKVGEKGLAGVLEGFEEMKAGKVSGEKLVYRIADTP